MNSKRIHNPEGYFADNNYHYYRRDHLGNNREVWNATANATVQKTQYYPSGLPWATNTGDNAGIQPYKYNGKEFIEMHGLDEYYSNFRNYYATIGRTTTQDAHAESYYAFSPYAWVGNRFTSAIDPDGKDWALRYKEGAAEYYYDRSITSQEDINNKYGEDSGITHVSTGTRMTVYNKGGDKIQYTFVNDAKENKYGTVLDTNGNTMDNSQIIYGDSYTIFGTTDNSVNAETLHGNLFGSSYIGPNNPKDYSGNDSYQYRPTWSPTEMAAYNHDLSYDALGAKGVSGALSPKTKCADMQLISDCHRVLNNSNSSPQEKSRAKKIITGFSIVNFFKPTTP